MEIRALCKLKRRIERDMQKKSSMCICQFILRSTSWVSSLSLYSAKAHNCSEYCKDLVMEVTIHQGRRRSACQDAVLGHILLGISHRKSMRREQKCYRTLYIDTKIRRSLALLSTLPILTMNSFQRMQFNYPYLCPRLHTLHFA